MKQKRLVVVATVCGLLCALCVTAFMISLQGEANAARAEVLARYGGEQVEVCVATRDIAAGERIDASSVETKLWVADLLPDGATRNASDAVGRTPTTPILKGEVISDKRFDKGHEAIDVPAGMEAVSVPAKAVQAVGGAVQAGARVDVYSSSATGTKLIADDALVLDVSVGDSGSLVSSGSGWVTLALESERVQEVVAAAYKTDLSFALPGEATAVDGSANADVEEPAVSAAAEKEADYSTGADKAE